MSAALPLASDGSFLPTSRGDLLVRPIWAGDAAALQRMHARLSPDSIYRRFMVLCSDQPSAATLRYLTAVDHRRSEALVAVNGDEIVAVARYHTVHEGEAEIAVLVEDAWQRFGIARSLISQLTRHAQRRGIRVFSGAMLADNRAAVALMKSLFPDVQVRIIQGEIDFRIPLDTRDASGRARLTA